MGCYIGAVTRTGVRFRGVNVTDVYARGVNVYLTPLTSKRGALATDAVGLWRYLLERPPHAVLFQTAISAEPVFSLNAIYPLDQSEFVRCNPT